MKPKSLKTLLCAGALSVLGAVPASAHVWDIGYDMEPGSLTFYAVSYHTLGVGGAGSVDDFASYAAGLTINGIDFTYDLGVTDMSNCGGPGGLAAGSCDGVWNALGMDGAFTSLPVDTSIYGKFATLTLDSTDLATLGLGVGLNVLSLEAFATHPTAVDWNGLELPSLSLMLSADDLPAVPLPAGGLLLLSGLGAAGLFRRKKTAA